MRDANHIERVLTGRLEADQSIRRPSLDFRQGRDFGTFCFLPFTVLGTGTLGLFRNAER